MGWHNNYMLSMFPVTLHSCYANVTVVKSYICGSISHVTHIATYF